MQWIYTVDNLNSLSGGGSGAPSTVKNLYYCSVDGIQIAVAKIILHTDGSPMMPVQGAGGPPGAQRIGIVDMPSGLIFVPIFLLICALFMVLAWSRIRAVEVVG
jgi:hypothetical protein